MNSELEQHQEAGPSINGGTSTQTASQLRHFVIGAADNSDMMEVDLEFHDLLLDESVNFKHENDFKELLRLRFKLVANRILRQQNSLDGINLPPKLREKVKDLFAVLDWAVSDEDEFPVEDKNEQ